MGWFLEISVKFWLLFQRWKSKIQANNLELYSLKRPRMNSSGTAIMTGRAVALVSVKTKLHAFHATKIKFVSTGFCSSLLSLLVNLQFYFCAKTRKKSYFKQKNENKEKKTFDFFPVVDSNLNQTWTFGDTMIVQQTLRQAKRARLTFTLNKEKQLSWKKTIICFHIISEKWFFCKRDFRLRNNERFEISSGCKFGIFQWNQARSPVYEEPYFRTDI